MTKKELEILSAVQKNNYDMADSCKQNNNSELADSYIAERVAVNRFMRSIGYEWNYSSNVFEKEGE